MIDIKQEAARIRANARATKSHELQYILRQMVHVDETHQYFRAIQIIGVRLMYREPCTVIMSGDEECAKEMMVLINEVFPDNKIAFVIDPECDDINLNSDYLLLRCEWRKS